MTNEDDKMINSHIKKDRLPVFLLVFGRQKLLCIYAFFPLTTKQTNKQNNILEHSDLEWVF